MCRSARLRVVLRPDTVRPSGKKEPPEAPEVVYATPEFLPVVPRFLRVNQRGAFAYAVGRILHGFGDAPLEVQHKKARAFMRAPEVLLGNQSHRSAARRAIATGLTEDEVLAAPGPAPPKDRPTREFEERMRLQAETYARQGYLGKAARTLCTKDIPLPPLPELIRQLEGLHPADVVPFAAGQRKPQPVSLGKLDNLRDISRQGCHGKAPGPSGWTEELLHYLCSADEESDTGIGIRDFLEYIVNGNCADDIADALTASVLMALPKDDKKVRPIAMGEAILRLASRVALKQCGITFSGHQFAFRPKGAEIMSHRLRDLVSKGYFGMSLDMQNAFNMLKRAAFLDVCPDGLLPLVKMTYCREGFLYLRRGPHILHILKSRRGVRQGDVLGPILFALAIDPILSKIAAEFGVEILAYLDDITVLAMDPAKVTAATAALTAALAEIGLHENVAKRQPVSTNSPSPIKIVGAYVAGPADAIKEALVKKVPTAFFSRLPRLHPTIALLLLRVCGEPRFTFLARTHPYELLEEAAHVMDRTSCEALASILALPVEDLQAAKEALFLASLPVKMGGLAATNWVQLAPVAYEASKTGMSQKLMTAALYKKALADPEHAASAKHAALQAAYLSLPG